jgi:hypothetical protein
LQARVHLVQRVRATTTGQTNFAVWFEKDGRAAWDGLKLLVAGHSLPSGIDIPTAAVRHNPRGACHPSTKVAPLFLASLPRCKSSSAPVSQNRVHQCGTGSSVGQTHFAKRQARHPCLVLRQALAAVCVSDRYENGAPNVAAGCDRGSTRDETLRPPRRSRIAPSDIRQSALECQIGSRLGSARE